MKTSKGLRKVIQQAVTVKDCQIWAKTPVLHKISLREVGYRLAFPGEK